MVFFIYLNYWIFLIYVGHSLDVSLGGPRPGWSEFQKLREGAVVKCLFRYASTCFG